MPERSFGRTIRYRRSKSGLSQSKLGELVGRSASTIRSWERDISTPNDPLVLDALSAVLNIDRRILYEKAEVGIVMEETSPTVEQALATLAPSSHTVEESPVDEPGPSRAQPEPVSSEDDMPEVAPSPVAPDQPELDLDDDDGLTEPEDAPYVTADEGWATAAPPYARPAEFEPQQAATPAPAPGTEEKPDQLPAQQPVAPGYVSPEESLLITAPIPPVVEPSYMEDTTQRQMYRVRNLATVVLLVALVIVLLWAFSNTFSAFSEWWDDFFGNLRL